MESFLLVLHVILSFVIVVVILLQSGQGGGLGAGFNNAAALGQEVFGGRGAAGFLVKLTVVLGATFMITSMALAWYSSKPQSALDLQMEADEPAQSQVHQVLEEGQGEFEAPEVTPDELNLEMPGDQRQPMPGADGDSPIELDVDGDGEEIPAEIREQLEELELDVEEAPEPMEQPVEPVEIDQEMAPETEPEVEEAPEPEVEEAPEPEVEEAPEPEVEETPEPEPEVEEAPEPEVEEAPEPEAEEEAAPEEGEE